MKKKCSHKKFHFVRLGVIPKEYSGSVESFWERVQKNYDANVKKLNLEKEIDFFPCGVFSFDKSMFMVFQCDDCGAEAIVSPSIMDFSAYR